VAAFITALYGAALLAFAVYFGIAVFMLIAPSYDKLSGRGFVEYFQKTDPYMRGRAPLISLAQVATTLPLLGLTCDRWAALPFWLTLLALATALVAAAVAVQGNVPLNRQMERWSPAEPPPGWEQVRDRWLRYHHLRGAASIAGFVLLLAAARTDSRPPAPSPAADDAPAPRRWEATVYLPLADNQGQPFGETEWQQALGNFVAPFGGATLGQSLEGCWLDERGRLCREWVRPVVISFVPERLAEFRAAVHGIGKHLGQEAVYVRFEEPRVALIRPGAAPLGAGR
jgi:hypothetical protein